MNDLMIDTETTGTSHHSGIISFAAAFFNPDTGDKGDSIYLRLDWVSATRNGAVIDPETFCFWLEQSTEARLEAVRKDECVSERDGTYALINFIEQRADIRRVRVWAKSPVFDCSLIRDMCDRSIGVNASAEMLWPFWNERDVRTVEGLAAHLGIPLPYIRKDVTHHALSDVMGQIKNVAAVFAALRGVTEV
ncbi:3'-5' exoribonuclease [Escherichia coli]|nr:3'-5' exoribonuclease [Escherichia coli]EEU4686411.1 3'-5' exoribonuclease [Escherichia coli]EEV0712226.1 3'-5' exoribonuclease [Escherichia coli]EEV7679037.1 3'-5' exoribonuclease [Escherichia coli]EFF0151007.1 3'-5' exoribonuclease [Escherichia coli]